MDKFKQLQEGIRNQVPVKDIAKLYVAYVHSKLGNNKVRTAQKLGIDRRTIQRWGIDVRTEDEGVRA